MPDLFAANIPIPRDLDLLLPLGEYELKVILIVLFLLHIFFVNLMLGGSVLAVLFEIIGLSFPRYDKLAKKITETVTVNKSLAVVLGVGPLLCINLVYTPPEERRRGYATALVGTLSRMLLGQGRSFCALYTDLANETSNSVYRRIGYKPTLDCHHYRFAG